MLVNIFHIQKHLHVYQWLFNIFLFQLISDNGFEPGYNGLGGFSSGRLEYKDTLLYDKFPEDFMWSSATAAYQVEGGWNEDGNNLRGIQLGDSFEVQVHRVEDHRSESLNQHLNKKMWYIGY